jgi:hypothetical protein
MQRSGVKTAARAASPPRNSCTSVTQQPELPFRSPMAMHPPPRVGGRDLGGSSPRSMVRAISWASLRPAIIPPLTETAGLGGGLPRGP